MKNIYFIILYLICFYSYSQIEETETKGRWEVLGSNKDGSVILKLEESNFYNFAFRNYQFSDKQIIQSIYFNSSELEIFNLYSFLYKSFDLFESDQSLFKIDKYEFQVFKKNDDIRIKIISINSKEIIGLLILSIKDLNNLFGIY
tara:strand:- start:8 stop:442 length:435 start_codon:yes stop_codon:yes gene_type:complete